MGYVAKVLQLKEHGETINWMPSYGCAILLKFDAGYTAGMVDWNLISLDLHQFDTTSKLVSNGYEYVDSAHAMDYEVLHIGTSQADEVEQLQSKFQALLATAQTRSGSQRSSHGGSSK